MRSPCRTGCTRCYQKPRCHEYPGPQPTSLQVPPHRSRCCCRRCAVWGFYIRMSTGYLIGMVTKEFVFYPEYSHGQWGQEHQESCPSFDPSDSDCWHITYTIPVQGCGDITLSWGTVFPEREAVLYHGTSPRIDEYLYPLFARYDRDSRTLQDFRDRSKPLPETCQ